ncbi:Helicase conserved C-terminal domain-containing protein [Micromonospora echinaurantiaca]|uniref:Helicase conserved C-terminal domain-containing protein n=1 Tax=Micromonospora echinaurantiaca TaxID=47857 RepID=A0A1C5JSD6_9ACTN|nr:DEAD/DEAH box helicase [Micromonospora echinaurantiaca]SCG72936.1 Helicase conserved C-terminal domain-containing protein [Micromonospora echinaurantiaca]
MSALLPTLQASSIRQSLVNYLTTTFGLTDGDARDSLHRFLSDPESGMFKGPYVRLRLPFRPADEGWRDTLEWYEGFPPYGHQAAAFARLASSAGGQPRRPAPTLVTTGTGSGKTEAFLYPILDHVLRARRHGVTGTKALILYPMNALANDQAARLTKLLTTNPELADVTAALYTGQTGPTRTAVTPDGLITDRAIIRDAAPDILLTNYKMLDQLLLRADDQELWQQSATSLRYLVLDEFHTYDGAQGTDVAMLLRRLGLALKSHWSDDDPQIDEATRSRPLGLITPVATSATLGDKGDPTVMLDFAHTVFGERFDADAVVTETRLSLDEWIGNAVEVAAAGFAPADLGTLDVAAAVDALGALGHNPTGEEVTATVLGLLYGVEADRFADASPELLLALCRAHPLVQDLARKAEHAVALDTLMGRVLGYVDGNSSRAETLLSYLLAMLGYVRAVVGRDALSVDVHLWVRELTRIDRAAAATTRFRWSDDGPPVAGTDGEEVRPSFPAIYCRHCGRSGWGIGLAPVGHSLAAEDEGIRRNHATREGRFRPLLYAPAEAAIHIEEDKKVEGLVWFSVRNRELVNDVAEDDRDLRDGWVLPVLTNVGNDADEQSRKDTCPSCGQEDGIRFLGSAVATLLSVSLSTLFGSPALDAAEKKALVFTDSVQDAAHRAGFVQARSHTLTLRSVLREAVAEGALTLDALVDEVIQQAGDKPFARYRVIAPDCADRESFTPFWQAKTLRSVPAAVRARVRKRLALDAALEFGLNSHLGRTLELTGSVAVAVEAGKPARMARVAHAALQGTSWQDKLDSEGPDDVTLVQWVRGVLERMRAQGAIDHPWFARYRLEDGRRWSIWAGRPRSEGMPAFPRGRPAPAYPKVGGSSEPARDGGLDPVTSPKSWYARWTSRVLDVSPLDGGRLARGLFDRLAREGLLTTTTSESGATVYAIPSSGIVIAPTTETDLAEGRHLLTCDTCRAATPGTAATVEQLTAAPCLNVRCGGHLRASELADNFYRRLYASPDMRRIVAREHTSLLDDETRLQYEDGFRDAATSPQAPNVLVATPTLEMGIDIGDLSAVFLASLPRTVASYLQRVGRAGRLTGNALNLAFVTGRGEHLPKLGDPLSVIDGEVRPPATYLAAEEILRRQYTAYLVDGFGRVTKRRHPRAASGAIGSSAPGTFLGDLVLHAEQSADEYLPRFLATFGELPEEVVSGLRDWLRPANGPRTSAFAAHVQAASRRWQDTVETLQRRQKDIDALLPELEARVHSPAATDDDKQALRSAKATRKLTTSQLAHLRSTYWISVLEEYGLLPNYTLLDDTVTLDVGLSWTDPDSGTHEYGSARFERGSAQALSEFAPGATFYARGWEIEIDAVDLGLDGASIRTWAFCPHCGYAVDIAESGREVPVSSCPRCGSTGIGDTGQRLDVVELTRVSAEVRRDEVTISDRKDERGRVAFHVVPTADIDPAHITRRWFAESTGLGCTYLRTVDLRWLNMGPSGHGATRTIAGGERQGTLFRVCAGCGKKDTESGRNRPHEHRPWCPYRTSPKETTKTVALARTLRTQGLLIRLPHAVSLGDDFALPSLSAALLLGLREQMGGHPDHIRVEHIVDPTLSDGTDNHEALLLHDAVPGGTGYLAETADPERLRDLLVLAWNRVRDCECRHEERLACHRCLLPFTAPGAIRRVSRASAERHLRTLLGLAPETETAEGTTWTVTEVAPHEEPESHLERAFHRLIVGRLRRNGAAVTEVPGPSGNIVRFTLPGAHRQWTLTPQVDLAGSRPDFLLETNDMNVPDVAIFTDGRAYHASAAVNRLADDARKRANLRDAGLIVLAVTIQDVAAEDGSGSAPDWYNPALAGNLMNIPQFQAPPEAYRALGRGPVDWLIDWIVDPNPSAVGAVARAVPMFVSGKSRPVQVSETVVLEEIGRAVLVDEHLPAGDRRVFVHRAGALAVVVEMSSTTMVVQVAAVLDDRDEVLDDAHAKAWRAWLRFSNALALRDWPTVVTTTSLVGGPSDSPSADDASGPGRPMGAWADVYDAAAPGDERNLVAALAAQDGLATPVVGAEGPDGIPLDLSWPDLQIVVAFPHMPRQDRVDLAAAGWRVLDPSPELVAATLADVAPEKHGDG